MSEQFYTHMETIQLIWVVNLLASFYMNVTWPDMGSDICWGECINLGKISEGHLCGNSPVISH